MHDSKNDETAMALACLYATYLMDWQENSTRREKEPIALVSCTLVCYDLGYKIITGNIGLVNWIKQVKE